MAYTGSTREATKPQITSWSYSRLKTYLQCPFKAKCQMIDKLKEAESPQMLEGKRLHALAEDYLNNKLADVPEELKLFAEDYKALRDHSLANPGTVYVEHGAAFRKDLGMTEWYAQNAWLRVRFDVMVINDDASAVIIDLKTGKRRQEDKDQLSLFALGAMLMFPLVEEVRTELWYSSDGALVNGVFVRSGFERLRDEWLGKAAPMLADTEFLPTPNQLCSWCAFSKLKGGPCPMA